MKSSKEKITDKTFPERVFTERYKKLGLKKDFSPYSWRQIGFETACAKLGAHVGYSLWE